jgi:protein-disulfide isomerase
LNVLSLPKDNILFFISIFMPNPNNKLVATILLAAILVSGALVYVGYNFANGNISEDAFEVAVNNYAAKQQAAAQKAQAEASKPQLITQEDLTDDDAFLGEEDAPVTIVEFSEYQCPYCKRHFDQVMPQIKEKYIDTGKVKYIFRDFPLEFHDQALPAALAAECAGDEGNDKYFEMHDKLFENQADLSEEKIKELAEEIGLDMSSFDDCFDNETYKEEVEKDAADGKSIGVTGTPAFIINGWGLKGAQPFSEFEKLIEQELAK